MRLFTGIAIAPEVTRRLEALLEELRPLAKLRWSPAENLHITTKFIGEWPEQRLGDLERALGEARRPGAFPISVGGFGFFPNEAHPKTFFAGVHADARLPRLAHALDEALEAVGCARETRPYSPHLTLARLKHENIGQLRQYLTGVADATMANSDFGSFEATAFHLYLSRPGSGGSVYTRLASWRLA